MSRHRLNTQSKVREGSTAERKNANPHEILNYLKGTKSSVSLSCTAISSLALHQCVLLVCMIRKVSKWKRSRML